MKIRVLYFASLRERLGTEAETIDLPAGIGTVGELRQWLLARGGVWADALARPDSGRDLIRAAVSQQMATADTPLADGVEVAFFPPVTGG
ncbi:MAG: molybdopterin converting factor subunit 1 [Lautropia sp.]|nr:molybdopterin converting factor subunit 1 [Lautropia sp.]